MDKRTLLFVLISVMVFILWSVVQRPKAPSSDETAEPAALDDRGEPSLAPGSAVEGRFAPARRGRDSGESAESTEHRAHAEVIRDSDVTVVTSSACEIEIAHRTASLRSWRLLHYPRRGIKGRLTDEPVDLVSVYSPDYAGTRINGELLDWTPVGSQQDHIWLNGGNAASIAFSARLGDVEITKTFVFRPDADEWSAYSVDIQLEFRNLGHRPTDALTYELRWGPGITGDRETYDPKFGGIGGTLTRAELPSFDAVRDRDVTTSGPQDKDGELVDMSGKRTIWAAMDSKYFVVALMSDELGPVRGVEREVVFSEFEAIGLPWDQVSAREREIERLGLIAGVGKDWMVDEDHLWQEKSRRTLMVIPSGTMSVNDEILTSTANVKDDDKAHRKLRDKLLRVYAEYTTVIGLLTGTRLEVSGFFLDPGQSVTDRFRLYAGPKHTEMLAQVTLPDDETPARLNETIRLGFFAPVAKTLLWLLKLFHTMLQNYGASIILLTIVVRTALYPLSQRSSQSMKKTQARQKIIQPFIDEVRNKYRDDPQRINTETMKVYRKYGINPAGQLGGCLVMLAQMPIFIAMFQMLRNAAELRGEPFILWITDLTAPDLLFTVAGIPIRILPLFMTAGTILQQKMNPAGGTMGGSQRTLMYMMPLMFLFILYNMASGLNLYWGASTLLGVGQQFLVNKYGKSTGEEDWTAADLERMATQERKRKRRRGPSLRP